MTNIHDTMMETSCIRTRDIAWRNSDTRLLQQLLFFRLHNDYVPQSKLVSILYRIKILIAWFFEEETYQHLRTPRGDSVAAHQARLGIVARQAVMPLFPILVAHRTVMRREARWLTNVALFQLNKVDSLVPVSEVNDLTLTTLCTACAYNKLTSTGSDGISRVLENNRFFITNLLSPPGLLFWSWRFLSDEFFAGCVGLNFVPPFTPLLWLDLGDFSWLELKTKHRKISMWNYLNTKDNLIQKMMTEVRLKW